MTRFHRDASEVSGPGLQGVAEGLRIGDAAGMARTPNDRLAQTLRLAGLSNRQTARRINALAQATGLNVAVDTARVGRWLGGEHPREPVPNLLLAVLREHFGERLTLADIGLARPSADPLDPAWGPDTMRETLESLHRFAGGDLMTLTRRDLTQLALGAPLLAAADRLWRSVPNGPAEPVAGKIGTDEVEGVEALVRHLRALDASHGGELWRQTIVAQLNTVIGLLRDQQSPTVTRRLYQAATDLAQLAGWTSHDAGLYGIAQRYWAYAVALAREADDPGRGAEVVSRMAHQMVYLGHPDHALALLDRALTIAGPAHNQRLLGMLTAQRGRMLAALGDHQESRTMLGRAAEHLHEAETTGEPVEEWIAYFTPAELAGATAVAHRDLLLLHNRPIGPASTHFARAIELRDEGYDRVRAMDMIGMAAAYLDEDEPERAGAVAGGALDLAERLDSTLIRSRVLTLTAATDHYANHPAIRTLHDRAAALAADPSLQAA